MSKNKMSATNQSCMILCLLMYGHFLFGMSLKGSKVHVLSTLVGVVLCNQKCI